MVKIEEIEDFYKKETEKIDKEFLNKISKVVNKKEKIYIETEYKRKTKILRNEYEKKIVGYLKEQKQEIKKQEMKKTAKKIKKEDFKKFVVKKLDLNETWKDKLEFKWELFKFKHKINSKNFKDRHMPESMKVAIIKSKISIKNFLSLISKFIFDLLLSIKKFIFNVLDKLKEAGLFIFAKLKILIKGVILKISLISSKIFKKKKAEENKEKRPDEEIAEKLLRKDKEKK
jgi:hypothetical protein